MVSILFCLYFTKFEFEVLESKLVSTIFFTVGMEIVVPIISLLG